jgi:hypothetical protein
MSNEKYFSPEDVRIDREGYRCLIPQALTSAIDISKGALDYLADGNNATFRKLLEKKGLDPETTVIMTACGIRESMAELIIEYYAYETRLAYQKPKAVEIYNDYKDVGFTKWLDRQLGINSGDSQTESTSGMSQLIELLDGRSPKKIVIEF